ncbi:MAG: sugar O-acetyltransferase [Oscillospiraceae bacterium]|nr:sugar O-acetyltransferase [Oscillospiraceae bacterium]
MTEEKKLLARKIFNPVSPELAMRKQKAHNISVDYGMTHEDESEKRRAMLEDMLGQVGQNVRIQGPVFFNYGCHTRIGDNFFANYNFTVQDDAEVEIGQRVNIGPNVTITTPFHPLVASERAGFTAGGTEYPHPCYAKPIRIGDDVWVGAGVIICGGVTIGCGAVSGAGSVVTRDIPANTIAGGVPCRVMREITESDSMQYRPELL